MKDSTRRAARETVWYWLPLSITILFVVVWTFAWLVVASVTLYPLIELLGVNNAWAFVFFVAVVTVGGIIGYKLHVKLQDYIFPEGPYKLPEDEEDENLEQLQKEPTQHL